MILNNLGKVLKGYKFILNRIQLEITDCYKYLGVKLRPSGSCTAVSEELCNKARRAWFSISKIIYKDKRIPVKRAFELFDLLRLWNVVPILFTKEKFPKFLSCWENLKCETLNQYCSRILLSKHRKASRLAVLGDLGRFPMAVRALAHTLNYKLCLENKPTNSLIGHTITEMKTMSQNQPNVWVAGNSSS